MSRSLIIAERDNIAAIVQDQKVIEFYIHRGDILLGDVYLSSVENILPSIDAAFVNVGSDKMGFLHASDVAGKGILKEKLKPKQKLLVQVVKEPTGHKGPRVTTEVSLPGRFLVLMPDEKGINVSRKIASSKERARLKSIVSLLKPSGIGIIIRTEAEGQSESEIQEDLELLLEKWNSIVTAADTVVPPNLIYRDQDLLYRVIREACNEDVNEIILDTTFGLHRTNQLIQSWNLSSNIKVSLHKGSDPLLVAKGIDKELRQALQTKVTLPSGGYLFIQQTEALTVIDVNSGKFISSATQNETIRKTNLEAIAEIARQLRLRNIGGMIIIDLIDMESRVDKLTMLEELELAFEPDKAKAQVGQLSDLGLVELTRHRQGQSLAEIFTKKCPNCSGTGAVLEDLSFTSTTQEGELRAKASKIKLPHKAIQQKVNTGNNKLQVQQTPQKQESRTQTVNKIQIQQKHKPKETINTSPSLVASLFEQKKRTEAPADFRLSEEILKKFLLTKGYVLNIAKFVRFGALPPKIANEYMPKSYLKDVFTIVQEIEAGGTVAVEVKQEVHAHHRHSPHKAKEADEEKAILTETKASAQLTIDEITPLAQAGQQGEPIEEKPKFAPKPRGRRKITPTGANKPAPRGRAPAKKIPVATTGEGENV